MEAILVQPLEGAFNWFLALFQALPFVIRALFSLSISLFSVGVVVQLLRKLR